MILKSPEQGWAIIFPMGPNDKPGLSWRTAPISLERDKINFEQHSVQLNRFNPPQQSRFLMRPTGKNNCPPLQERA